jgi:hypothetical protein
MAFRSYTFSGWTWSAVFAGVITALIFQVLLVILGFGFGLLAIDVPTADAAPKAVSWAIFTWWAVSGVIAAFAGGWVAANFSDSFTPEGRATHALMAWAVATLIVIGVTAFTTANSVASNLVGPAGTTWAQYQRLVEPRAVAPAQARPATQAQLEQARRNLAIAMLASFFALLIGAGAATAGSQWLPDERVHDARQPYPPPAR